MSEAINLADATFLEIQKRLMEDPLNGVLQAATGEALKECLEAREAEIERLTKERDEALSKAEYWANLALEMEAKLKHKEEPNGSKRTQA